MNLPNSALQEDSPCGKAGVLLAVSLTTEKFNSLSHEYQ